MWQEETRGHALSRQQQRVLAGTSRVTISGLDITLRSGGGSKLSSGTPTGLLANATAFGVSQSKQVTVTNKKGTTYKRRMGTRFPQSRRGGYVVYPAARQAIPRIASLVVQTTRRAVYELVEKVSR